MESQMGSSKEKSNYDLAEYLTDSSNLSEMFDTGFEMYNSLNKSEEAINSSKVQLIIKKIMKIFENSTRLVSLVNMFSDNECLEEVSTENIKYLMLPALLGFLTTKICETDNRIHIIEVAEIYFIDFLKRLKSYGIISIDIPEVNREEKKEKIININKKSNKKLITDMVHERNIKIKQYQDQKELEKLLYILKQNLHGSSIDDENKRKYFVTLIKVFANQAINELSSIASERSILEQMKTIIQDSHAIEKESQKYHSSFVKLQPIIITRDAVQKKVFGAGYPSLPILTVQEFYDQKINSGEWPGQSQRNNFECKNIQNLVSNTIDKNDIEKDGEDWEEQKIEKDDLETLVKARAMDEYKDTHRRGWGNRANRS